MVAIANRRGAEVDSADLAAVTVLSIGSVTPNPMVRNFMMKNLETHFHVSIPNLGDSFIVVLADSDASVTELAAALSSTNMDLEDGTAYDLDQTKVRRIWSIATIPYNGMVAGGSVQYMHAWKLPPKGVPILKGRGLDLFVFNTDAVSAFSNGPTFKWFSKYMGGWF